MRTYLLPLLGLASLLASVACGDGTTSAANTSGAPATAAEKPGLATSALSRNTAPNVPSADAEALVAGNTALAFDMYKALGSGKFAGTNLFFSPHSISVALAMTYAGARGTTETEMASALHFTLPQSQLHNALNGLDLALSSRGAGAKAADGNPFRLRVSNSLWGLPRMPFEQAFLDTIATNYGAGVRLTDFEADPESARNTINAWVEGETEQRIKELLGQGTITRVTRMVLVNAVYFNAAWATPFEPSATREGTFRGLGGDVTASFMTQTSYLDHLRGDGFDAVKVPYDGQELDLVAIAPEAGTLDAFESTLDAKKLETILSSMTGGQVELKLPKFKIEGGSFSVSETLNALGMKAAWSPATSDFSGMLPRSVDELYLTDVVHKAFVAVDEKGTEAAAATAVVEGGTPSLPPEPTKIALDRPFVFAVRDRATGAIVFLGRVATP